MTKLQRALLAFAAVTERNEGIPPSVRELQQELELRSTGTALRWMDQLELEGLVYIPAALRGRYEHRSRQLTPQGWFRVARLREEAA